MSEEKGRRRRRTRTREKKKTPKQPPRDVYIIT
jgi:phage terminase large subunit-like protein